MNEGFATYIEALWVEHRYGREAFVSFMNNHDWGHGEPTDALIRDASVSWPPYYFRTISYHKGAWVLHMLRRQLGDEDFFQSLRDYVNAPALRYDNAHSDDFQAVCEEVSGQDLDSFFDLSPEREIHSSASWLVPIAPMAKGVVAAGRRNH